MDDAGVDAPVSDETVNVTALVRWDSRLPPGSPYPGAYVVAVNTAGALVDVAVTDVDGKATVSLPGGGSITVIYAPGWESGNTLVTYVGVKPGDSLTFGTYNTSHAPTSGQEGQMTVTWPEVDNAYSYRLATPCYSSIYVDDPPVTFDLWPDCQTPTAPLGLAALNDSLEVIASLYLPTTATTPGTNLNITANQWVVPTAYDLTVTNIDTMTDDLEVGAFDEFITGEYGGFWWSFPPRTYWLEPTEGEATQSIPLASTAPRKVAAAKIYHSVFSGRQWLFKSGDSPITLDAANVPWVESADIDGTGKASWVVGSGTYDATKLQFNYRNINWNVLLPPGVTEFSADGFPAELAPYLPEADDEVFLSHCELVDLASTDSYDALRALPEWRAWEAESAVRRGDEASAALADCGEGYHFYF